MGDDKWRAALPSAYAAEKLQRMRSRWEGELGDHLRVMAPIAWPDAPPTAFLGFTAFARGDEDTVEASSRQPFHELGYFQTEGGPRDDPAPSPDPKAEYNAWGALAKSELVTRLLGRPATMVSGAWRTAVADQTAVGLANLRRHLSQAQARLPDALAPKDLGGTWAVLLAFTAFSRGEGRLSMVLKPYIERLAAVDERDRWSAWERLVVDDIRAGRTGVGTDAGHGGAPYAILRSRQKHDSGRLAAEVLGEPTRWFLKGDPARDETFTRRALDD